MSKKLHWMDTQKKNDLRIAVKLQTISRKTKALRDTEWENMESADLKELELTEARLIEMTKAYQRYGKPPE